ncbi:MAG: single-stranded-DNA-specific exonuclease RecJ [Gemmatimonadota bacterium]
MKDLPPVPRRWAFRDSGAASEDIPRALAGTLRLPDTFCRLLANRGVTTPDAAKRFLRPRPEHLHDPDAMTDMAPFVARVAAALDRGETILVHGDYDVDGICATALYTRVLRALGGRVQPFVPHRARDGYDLGPAGVKAAQDAGASLLITADCGIVAHDAAAAARRAGIDVLVSDHHTPAPTLPPAVAVLNPKRADCAYPNEGLCGAGVAFKACQALARARGLDEESLLYHLDLVALATVADLVPLTDENRVMVHFGLRVLKETRNPGLRALLVVAGLADRERLSTGHLSHVLAPRINAVGRMADAMDGVRLLLTENDAEARALAERLDAENHRRRAMDRSILEEAVALLAPTYDPDRQRAIVLASDRWHAGVIGIVASRLVEKVHRPTALIALRGDGHARGSARSIPGFDLYAAIRDCGEHLERYGGHRAAAGFDIRPDRIDAFRAAFDARARAMLTDDQLVAEVGVDLELSLGAADQELYRYLRHMAPFGIGNPTPVFVTRGVDVSGARRVGDGHVKMRLLQDGAGLDAIGFRMADRYAAIEADGRLDVAFQLQEDHWRGRVRLQAKLVDMQGA